jgi:hypothetical protein
VNKLAVLYRERGREVRSMILGAIAKYLDTIRREKERVQPRSAL